MGIPWYFRPKGYLGISWYFRPKGYLRAHLETLYLNHGFTNTTNFSGLKNFGLDQSFSLAYDFSLAFVLPSYDATKILHLQIGVGLD
jgi:hypothetical protein